jgi:acyl-CoA synthetase (AMP-forming)/AMP-acid ligase II
MNITSQLREHAKQKPQQRAVVFPKKQFFRSGYDYQSLSYGELEKRANKYASALNKLGLKKGTKTLLFVKPSLEFAVLAVALFRAGAVPVLIDPAMGKANLFNAVKLVQPRALIAVPKVFLAKLIYPDAFKSIEIELCTNSLPWLGVSGISSLNQIGDDGEFPIANCGEDDLAAIAFTSGGTGIPKGVEYNHSIFLNQVEIIREIFKLSAADIDMPGFPLFLLFSIAIGMTGVIPDMDPTKPAQADPSKLVKNILDQKVTFANGSPAIWERVADYCLEKGITLDTLRNLMMFGAPVAMELHEKFKVVMPNGSTHTPYGATESLPVADTAGSYLLSNFRDVIGQGTCLGQSVRGVEVKIIQISDEPIGDIEDAIFLDRYQVGEIIVSGPIVTPQYHNMPDKTAEAKIYDKAGKLWHRMGDVGYLDDEDNLWFCGRKIHRVITDSETLFSVKCESIFNQHRDVRRSALIGLGPAGHQEPAIVVERNDGKDELEPEQKAQFEAELLALAKQDPQTRSIKRIFYSTGFPVDIRHNIKIDRFKLKNEFESKVEKQ